MHQAQWDECFSLCAKQADTGITCDCGICMRNRQDAPDGRCHCWYCTTQRESVKPLTEKSRYAPYRTLRTTMVEPPTNADLARDDKTEEVAQSSREPIDPHWPTRAGFFDAMRRSFPRLCNMTAEQILSDCEQQDEEAKCCACGYCEDEDKCPFAEWKELECYKMHACGRPGVVKISFRFSCADGQNRKLATFMHPALAEVLLSQLAVALDSANHSAPAPL